MTRPFAARVPVAVGIRCQMSYLLWWTGNVRDSHDRRFLAAAPCELLNEAEP